MATGPAVPNKAAETAKIFGPNHTDVETLRVQEEARKQSKAISPAELAAQGEEEPTGEEVHAKARELSPETAEGKAEKGEAPKGGKVTGQQVVQEARQDKKEAARGDDKAAAAKAEQTKAAQEKMKADDEARKQAAAQEAKDAAAKMKEPK